MGITAEASDYRLRRSLTTEQRGQPWHANACRNNKPRTKAQERASFLKGCGLSWPCTGRAHVKPCGPLVSYRLSLEGALCCAAAHRHNRQEQQQKKQCAFVTDGRPHTNRTALCFSDENTRGDKHDNPPIVCVYTRFIRLPSQEMCQGKTRKFHARFTIFPFYPSQNESTRHSKA